MRSEPAPHHGIRTQGASRRSTILCPRRLPSRYPPSYFPGPAPVPPSRFAPISYPTNVNPIMFLHSRFRLHFTNRRRAFAFTDFRSPATSARTSSADSR